MKIIKPETHYMSREGLTPYEFIEKIGRLCYKSEDKIAKGTAEPFVRGLVKRQHWAMLEHSNVIIEMTKGLYNYIVENFDTTYIRYTTDEVHYVMSGSFRAWRDMFMSGAKTDRWSKPCDISFVLYNLYQKYPLVFEEVAKLIYEDDVLADPNMDTLKHMKFIDEYTVKGYYVLKPELILEHITHTVHFICDRGVSHELVRHRPCSFAQESTRYCNYSLGKFDNEITFILPFFFDTGMGIASNSLVYETWKHSCSVAEHDYLTLLSYGAKPEEARTVLPNSLKTEIVVTATEKEWRHILDLRYHGVTGKPHPQMLEVMKLCYPDILRESDGRVN